MSLTLSAARSTTWMSDCRKRIRPHATTVAPAVVFTAPYTASRRYMASG